MNNKNELQDLARVVNKGLNNYIAVHDKIFNESATFKSLLKNIFGRGVSNEQLLKYAENLRPEWEKIQNRLGTYKVENYSNLDKDAADFFDKLFSYSNSIYETINILIDRQTFLFNTSLNKGDTSYRSYEEVNRRYEMSIAKYKHEGRSLNIAYYNL